MNVMKATQQDTPDKGKLKVNLTSEMTAYPVADATISISYTGVPDSQLEKLTTDSSGQTETIELDAPPLEYSLDVDNEIQPYSEYTLTVNAPGYEPVTVFRHGDSEHIVKPVRNHRPVGGDFCDSCTYALWLLSGKDSGG